MSTIQITDFDAWAGEIRQRVEGCLDLRLRELGVTPGPLQDAMRYATLDGGKRVRPLLTYATGAVVKAPWAALDAVAIAVEMIHAYSLVHDDMPCMDNDVLRRGKPTCHVAHGEARALLVGDGLQSLAFQVLAEMPEVNDAVRVNCVQVLARAAGSEGMVGGQDVDLQSTRQRLSLDALEGMHRMKTGALIGAAVRMAAHCGGAAPDVLEGLDRYAAQVGLMFQIVDDVLDHVEDSTILGKTSGKDARQGKATFVTLMGLEPSRMRAAQLERDALSALDPFGADADRLRQVCAFIARRKN